MLSKQNAHSPTIRILPRKDAKSRDSVSIYQDLEGKMLRLLANAPYRWFDVTSGDGAVVAVLPDAEKSVLATAEAIRAHYDIIAENKRPLIWQTFCKAEIARLAPFLASCQFGNAVAVGSYVQASTATCYGGFYYNGTTNFSDVVINSEEAGAAGLALLRAYQTTGTTAYLTAARNAATCLRRMQCGDKLTTDYTTTTDVGTARYHAGIWTHSMICTVTGGGPPPVAYDHLFYPGDLAGLTFLQALQAAEGDATYGDAAAAGEFASATSALNSVAQAEAIAFWTTGASNGGGTTITGLSSSTPYEYFAAYHSGGTSTGAWTRSPANCVSGLNFAKGLRALGSTFSAVWTWLMTFTSNTANRTSATASPSEIAAATTGTYDPTLALATSLNVVNATEATSATYEWATLGLLAAFQSASAAGALKTAKDQLAFPQVRFDVPSPRRAETDYVGLRGTSGLSLQVSLTATVGGKARRVCDLASVAMLMACYRQTPQLWNDRTEGA